MKLLLVLCAALAVAACTPAQLEVARKVAPTTVKAFEEEGLLAAADVFTGHIVVTCGEVDGKKLQVDAVAEVFNRANTIEKARAVRQRICDGFRAGNELTGSFRDPDPVEDELTPPVPVEKPADS